MPLTTSDLDSLATSPQSGTNDAGTVVARSAGDILKLDDRSQAVDAVAGANDQGGPKSGFRCLRPARATLPGAK